MTKKATRKKSSKANHTDDMQQRKLERVLLKKRIHAQREIVSLTKQLQRAVTKADVALFDLTSFLVSAGAVGAAAAMRSVGRQIAAPAHDAATEPAHAG